LEPFQQARTVVTGQRSADTTQMPQVPRSVLIGIPSFRRPHDLRNLLASLQAQQGVDSERVEVFVADNDPIEGEAQQVCSELARGFRWPLRSEIVDESGISAARNAILDRTREGGFDLVAMIDDDEIAASNWLSQLLCTELRFGADIIGGPVYPSLDSSASGSVRNCGLFTAPNHGEGPVEIVRGAGNILLRSATLAKVGWPSFDHSFGLTGGEDREFFARVRDRGFRFAWAPSAEAFESVPASRMRPSWILRRAFSHGHTDMRIRQHHRDTLGSIVSLAKAAALLATAPVGAALLLIPSRRLWILVKWSHSLGKLAALLGLRWQEYASSRVTGGAT
jgi:glycosyltransferase involved in cell wall biosynthesis